MSYNDTMQDGYEITEEDIQGMIHVLGVFDHKNANVETARKFLNHLKLTTRESVSSLDPEQLAELYRQMMSAD